MDEPVLSGAGWPRHTAAFYDSAAALASYVRSFVEHDRGAPVLIAAPRPSLDLLRAYRGDTGGRLRWADVATIGANPARIIPAIRAFADSHHGRAVRCVIEALWEGRTAEQRRETVRHEALVNQAFSGLPVVIMCAYNAALAGVAAAAELTHPVLIRDGTRRPSTAYDAAAAFPAGYDEPLEPVPDDAAALTYGENPPGGPRVRRQARPLRRNGPGAHQGSDHRRRRACRQHPPPHQRRRRALGVGRRPGADLPDPRLRSHR
jgi:MEDS: MEthanogen/methylotroph, DcmR Sensory domain